MDFSKFPKMEFPKMGNTVSDLANQTRSYFGHLIGSKSI
jgi:hypothetical protein